MTAGNSLNEGKDYRPWIQYTFDQVYSLGTMRVINFDGYEYLRGAKDVEVLVSQDGTTFTSLGYQRFLLGSSTTIDGTLIAPGATWQSFDLGGVHAKSVKLAIHTNYYGWTFYGSPDLDGGTWGFANASITGLREVQFYAPIGDNPLVQDFNQLGPNATASLAAGWRIDSQTAPNVIGTYAAAVSQTTQVAGASLDPNAENGIYNFGAGVANSQAATYWLNSIDRAPGWLSAGATLTTGGTKSGNLYVALRAPSDRDLTGIFVGYDVEKYKQGTNPSGFRVQLFSSTDGANWTNAGNSFLSQFAPDSSNAGYDPAPGNTVTVSPTRLSASILRGTAYYLAWNYTLNSSSAVDGGNGQAIGIDNVSLKGEAQCSGACGGGRSAGQDCSTDTDCAAGLICGQNNGACFGEARAKSVCWKADCATDNQATGCGESDSACGQNCDCATGCDVSATIDSCPTGESCNALGKALFSLPTSGGCLDAKCPSNDPALCGTASSLCGPTCLCTASCSMATCQNPSDGCGGVCPGVCNVGETCSSGLACPAGDTCMHNDDGTSTCRPASCAFAVLAPRLCGSPGAPCGDQCPACAPDCDGRQCGTDPACGQSCGTCSEGSYCSADGQCTTPTVDPSPTVPDGLGGVKTIAPLPPVTTTPVGAVKGQFSVSEEGTGQYSIPIEVPPGRAGIEPALSISYATTKINGDAGVGWHLEGLSKITRCPRTFAIDGYAAPVKNDTTDVFCIDGKRLEKVSPGFYGADGVEYRTLIDSFAKVVSHVSAGAGPQLLGLVDTVPLRRDLQGPDSFEVRTKDGKILTYGGTRNSLVMGHNGARYTWLLNRVADHYGNSMVVNYKNAPTASWLGLAQFSPNLVRPESISYTGHGTIAGNRHVTFSYEERADKQIGFLQGGVTANSPQRLSTITTFIKNVPVKNYRLQYKAQTLSQVEKIFECAGADDPASPGARCKKPTEFHYIQTPYGFSPQYGDVDLDLSTAGQLDLNGDGIVDFLKTNIKVDGQDANTSLAAAQTSTEVAVEVAAVAIGNVAGAAIDVGYEILKGPFWGLFGHDPQIEVTRDVRLGTGNRQSALQYLDNVSGMPGDATRDRFYMMDFDQDGKDDIVVAARDAHASIFVGASRFNTDGTGTFERLPADGSPFTTVPIPKFWTPSAGSRPVPFVGPAPILFDVNSDGLQDLISCNGPQTLEVRLRLPPPASSPLPPFNQGFAPPISPPLPANAPLSQPFCGSGSRPTFIDVLDIDGDGAPDLLVRGVGWVVLRYSQAPGAPVLSWQPVSFEDEGGFNGSAGGALNYGDFNGDGLADIWAPISADNDKNRSTVVWINAGGGHFASYTLAHPRPALDLAGSYRLNRLTTMDYDGDGRTDLLENWENPQNVDGLVFDNDYNVALVPDSQLRAFGYNQMAELSGLNLYGASFPQRFDTSADVDGDGSPDLLGDYGAVFYGASGQNTLLDRVVDGLGNAVDVIYDGGAYQTNDQCKTAWPERCLKQLHNIVSGYTDGVVTSSGSEIYDQTHTYRYTNARVSVTGHGWLGFDRRAVDVSRVGSQQSISTTTIDYEPPARYDELGKLKTDFTPPYIYPFAGLPKTITVDQHAVEPPATTLNVTPVGAPDIRGAIYEARSQTFNHWTVQLSKQNRPFPFTDTRVTSSFDRPVPSGGGALSFDDVGTLLSECDELNSPDGYGNVVQTVRKCGLPHTVTVEPFHLITLNSRETTSTVTTYEADEVNWLISNPLTVATESDILATGASDSQSYLFGYTQGLLTSVTRNAIAPATDLAQKHVTTYFRNDFGNIWKVTEAAPGETTRTTIIGYDVDNVYPSSVQNVEVNQTTQLAFNPRWGAPTMVTDPNGIYTQSVYDDFGKLGSSAGPTGTTLITYAAAPAGGLDSAAGHAEPRVIVSADQQGIDGTLGSHSSVIYDNRGRVVQSISQGFGGALLSTEQAYDGVGLLSGATARHLATNTSPSAELYSYDDLNRPSRVTHSDGSFREMRYATSASLGADHRMWLDGLNDIFAVSVTETIDEGTSPVSSDGKRNVSVTDYLGRRTRTIDGNNIDSMLGASNYAYGPFGHLVAASDNRSLTTGFGYDSYGRLTSQLDPDTEPHTYTYNGFDELKTSLDPADQLRTYSYDTLGRPFKLVDSVGGTQRGTTQWSYDGGVNALGRLTDSFSPATPENPGGIHIHYDYEPPSGAFNRGLVQSIKQTMDGTDYTLGFEYDGLGRTSNVHYPTTGGGTPLVAQYVFDPSGSGVLTQVNETGGGTPRSLWQLNEAFDGQLVQRETFGNTASTVYGYDPQRYWLKNIQTTLDSNSIQSIEYSHYTNGLVQGRSAAGSDPVTYAYDPLNRLRFVTHNPGAPVSVLQGYQYDDIGNIVNRAGTVTTYRDNVGQAHFVDRVGDNIYGYDPNGNVNSRIGPDIPGGAQSLVYTPFNLPASVQNGTDSSTTSVSFEYSADEERAIRRDNTGVTHYLSNLYERKLDSANTTIEQKFELYAGDRQLGEIIRKDGADRTLYFHTDHLGSPETISDSAHSSVHQSFDPFGSPIDPPDSQISRVGFTGQNHDNDLGLIDMKGRIYDPLAARFTSQDPVIQAPFSTQGLNRYSYVFNNPINATDPSGFDAADVLGLRTGSTGFDIMDGGIEGGLGSGLVAGASQAGWFGGGGFASTAGNMGTSATLGINIISDGVALFNLSGTPDVVTHMTPTAAPAGGGSGRGSTGAVGQNKGQPPGSDGQKLAFDPGTFCATNPRACALGTEVASDVGRVVRTMNGVAIVIGTLLNPSPLSDPEGPERSHRLYLHRMGGGQANNLKLRNAEKKLDPPGISLLLAETPEQAAAQVRAAFDPTSKIVLDSHIVGSTTLEAIQATGFDAVPDPRYFRNHWRLIHPNGIGGFSLENRQTLSKAFFNTVVP
jgi:RHS repeat-associated protein